MAEYLYPGVYVTEVPMAMHPIPGVSTSTSDIIGAETIAKLQRLIERVPHDWTDANQHDPGVALLELFAWLAEQLAYRMDQMSDESALASARLALAALALLRDRSKPDGSAIARVRFLEGKILDEKDLSTEQDYQRCLKIGGKRDAKNPLETFRYQVFVGGVLAGRFQQAEELSADCPKNLVESIVRAVRKLLGLRKFTNLTLKRGFVADRSLADWYRNIQAGRTDQRTVVIKRTEPSFRGEWHVKNARPAKIDGQCLDATANDAAIELLELMHEGICLRPS